MGVEAERYFLGRRGSRGAVPHKIIRIPISRRKAREPAWGAGLKAGRLVGRRIGGEGSHSLRIEDEGFGFRFGALGWELFAVPEETHSCGIADANDKFPRGAERGIRWGDESFLRDELSVGGDRDPGVFRGAHYKGQVRGGCV